MIKAKLKDGQTVVYRSSGWSLWPRVASNDQCTYLPVTSPSEVAENDIVFCEVQPGDRFFAYLVIRKDWQPEERKEEWRLNQPGRWKFTIGNLAGRENGWCHMEHIYGKLVHVAV